MSFYRIDGHTSEASLAAASAASSYPLLSFEILLISLSMHTDNNAFAGLHISKANLSWYCIVNTQVIAKVHFSTSSTLIGADS
jgi:hypothetical protein